LVEHLANAGEHLLLHIHDLAEDGRPENAACLRACPLPYPLAPHVHYAFLNSRDRSRFIDAGLPPAQAHLLANPIDAHPAAASPLTSPLVLYPVRGIRRKNLGEIVLLAALAPAGTRFAITRAPRNRQALEFHDGWRRFAAEMKLPVAFDVVDREAPAEGAGTSFHEWLDHATHLTSTSVSEGFGLVFLESIAWGKPLLGRALPHLETDHARHGIHSGPMYQRLLVPRQWLDHDAFDACHAETMRQTWGSWFQELPESSITRPQDMPDHADFGNLPEFLQQRVIRHIMQQENSDLLQMETADGLQAACKWLARALATRTPATTKEQLAPWSPQAHWLQLESIYQNLSETTPQAPTALDAGRILDACLTAENFHFLTAPPPARPAPDLKSFRAVIFDVYGTLLEAPAGGVKPDPAADPQLREIITQHGHKPPDSPSAALHAAVLRHHQNAGTPFPEVDLRVLWREVLDLPHDHDTSALVIETEAAWHPAQLMHGVVELLENFSATGIPLGILSNAQCNTLPSLGSLTKLFTPDLTILSYQNGIAKPSPALFELLAGHLAKRGIMPGETLYIGNDPLHDIEPAAALGFMTALFTGHPDSWRAGACFPDFEIRRWPA
jgi:FMN phosphatase YigB (HAD superfamily)